MASRPPAPGRVYDADGMDRMIGAVARHRATLMRSGHIDHLGRPVTMTTSEPAPEPVTHPGRCMKCRAQVDAVTKQVVDHPNGTKRAVGDCPTCGTAVHRIYSRADGQRLEQQLAATGGVPLQ